MIHPRMMMMYSGPGHFLEASKMLPLLTSPSDKTSPAFHVVAISLPNFGFSEAPKKKGFGIPQYAEAAHKTMLALGYDEYGESPSRLSEIF